MRRLLPLVGVLFAISSTAARAETPGLTVTGVHAGQTCWTGTVDNLVLSWGGGPIGDCPADQVELTLEGLIWSPGETFDWYAASDDGIRIWLDGQLVVDAWRDRPCQGAYFQPALPEGWHLIRIEWYENGGGTCLYLGRNTPDGFAWYRSEHLATSAPTTTTTTEPSTTTSSTTTTSTTLPPSTTSTSTTTTSTSTTSTTYQPATSSSAPSVTAPTPTSIQNPSTTSIAPSTTALETLAIPSTIPTTTSTTSTTTTVPAAPTTSGEALAEILTALDTVTEDQAEELFAALDEDTLTEAEGAALVAAVQDAPVSIRALFEDQVNIFAGATDSYIPLGSTVPVGTRRVIIITTGLLVAMPAPTTRRRP